MGMFIRLEKVGKVQAGSQIIKRGYIGEKPFFVHDGVTATLHSRRIPSSTSAPDLVHLYVGREAALGPGYASDLAPLHIGDFAIVGISYVSSGIFEGKINVYMNSYPIPFDLTFTGSANSYTLSFPSAGGGLSHRASDNIHTYDKIERDSEKKAILAGIFGGSSRTMRIDILH